MRTEIILFDAFNRDLRWITQEAIEEYAGALLHSEYAAEHCVCKWAGNDPQRIILFREVLPPYHPQLQALQAELIDEFGEEAFIGKARSKEYHIRQLEKRIETERDNDVVAKLMKELRELREWTVKPAEKGVSLSVTNIPATINFDRTDVRGTERIVASVLGSI